MFNLNKIFLNRWLVFLTALSLSGFASALTPPSQAFANYGLLPLAFEDVNGQFLSRGRGYKIMVSGPEVDLFLTQRSNPDELDPKSKLGKKAKPKFKQDYINMKLSGSKAGKAQVSELLPGKSNYFIGSSPKNWLTDVSQYGRVTFQGVYTGIDLVYYGNQTQLEYDFVVAQGSDYKKIEWSISGATDVSLDANGNLIMSVGGGSLQFKKPTCYVLNAGVRSDVPGAYELRGTDKVGFVVTGYNGVGSLVIDPTLSYSTYLGGSGTDSGTGVAVDVSGNAYVCGFTGGGFPTSGGAYQTVFGGSDDAFITKLNSTGTAVIYSTYLGGATGDRAYDIAVNSSGNAFVTGYAGAGFPVTAGAAQTTFGGGLDAFVAKLNSAGNGLVYSTYIGGSDNEDAAALALDASGNAYIIADTMSSDYPTTTGAYQTFNGDLGETGLGDLGVTKLNSTGTAFVYSTYVGGFGYDHGAGIAVDSSGNAYLTGYSEGSMPTTLGSWAPINLGILDTFFTKLNSTGTALVYSSYLGGLSIAEAEDIAVDASGNAYVTGVTNGGIPTTLGAYKLLYSGGNDAFVTKMNAAGNALVYSTYLGGIKMDDGESLAIDSSGNAYIGGDTRGSYPTTAGAYQTVFGGGIDIFVTQLDPTGSSLVYSSYLGGTGNDEDAMIAVDSAGSMYAAGFTNGAFPTTGGAAQTAFGGTVDGFVVKFGPAIPTPTFSATPTVTKTITPTRTITLTRTPTSTRTATATSTFSVSPTPSATSTTSPTSTSTRSPTPTPTSTFSNSPTTTVTLTSSPTSTFTNSPTSTVTLTSSPTSTFTNSPTSTVTLTDSPTSTFTDSPTSTVTETDSPTSTFTDSPTPTVTETDSPTATFTDSPTSTVTLTDSPTSTFTDSPTLVSTETDSPTSTFTDSPTLVSTETDSPTSTFTNSPTLVSTETDSPTETATPTITPSRTPTSSQTSTQISTQTFTPSVPAEPSFTRTPHPGNGDGGTGDHGHGHAYAYGHRDHDGDDDGTPELTGTPGDLPPAASPALTRGRAFKDGRLGEILSAKKPVVGFPNPAHDKASIAFLLENATRVRLVLMNLAGQQLETFDLGERPAGINLMHLDLGSYSRGIYFVVLETNSGFGWVGRGTFKLSVLR